MPMEWPYDDAKGPERPADDRAYNLDLLRRAADLIRRTRFLGGEAVTQRKYALLAVGHMVKCCGEVP